MSTDIAAADDDLQRAQPSPSRRLMEVGHVAFRLRYSEKKVRRLIHGGKLPAIIIGRDIRIDPADLEAFIDKHRTPNRSV